MHSEGYDLAQDAEPNLNNDLAHVPVLDAYISQNQHIYHCILKIMTISSQLQVIPSNKTV